MAKHDSSVPSFKVVQRENEVQSFVEWQAQSHFPATAFYTLWYNRSTVIMSILVTHLQTGQKEKQLCLDLSILAFLEQNTSCCWETQDTYKAKMHAFFFLKYTHTPDTLALGEHASSTMCMLYTVMCRKTLHLPLLYVAHKKAGGTALGAHTSCAYTTLTQ